jgi:hypothetical protein
LKEDGKLIISVPNELGMVGLVRFYGKKIKWKVPYGDFFKSNSEEDYIPALLFADFSRLYLFQKPNSSGATR